MIQWFREGRFPIEKIAKFYPVRAVYWYCCIDDLLICVQAEEFEKALADMKNGSAIKPVLTW